MAQSLLSGFIYLGIASIILTNVYLAIIHTGQGCWNGTSLYAGIGACNGTTGFGTYSNPQWSAAEVALWGVLGLAGIIALLLGALQLGGVM